VSVAIVTGSAGLVGSETARFYSEKGMLVVGVDNDMRGVFFGSEASTRWNREQLERDLGSSYRHVDKDIRDAAAMDKTFARYGKDVSLIVHAAAQPSHDWAATAPEVDFSVNAVGTLNLLEATRRVAPEAVFIHVSTNKVYGDTPNRLPLKELPTRWEIQAGHAYEEGIGEDMSVDQSLHSLFGVSKTAADLLVQEYGKYFGLKTACFRGGCLTGPNHSGAQLHGFLAYLLKCAVTKRPYTVFGYKGKQVRDNIHSRDLVEAFNCFFEEPRIGEVYNIGGGRFSNCSMLEAIQTCEELAGMPISWEYSDQHRIGDHMWWIGSNRRFESHYPGWQLSYDVAGILREMHEANRERWEREAE
jgi:CDP-paratose 2-epimerase